MLNSIHQLKSTLLTPENRNCIPRVQQGSSEGIPVTYKLLTSPSQMASHGSAPFRELKPISIKYPGPHVCFYFPIHFVSKFLYQWLTPHPFLNYNGLSINCRLSMQSILRFLSLNKIPKPLCFNLDNLLKQKQLTELTLNNSFSPCLII